MTALFAKSSPTRWSTPRPAAPAGSRSHCRQRRHPPADERTEPRRDPRRTAPAARRPSAPAYPATASRCKGCLGVLAAALPGRTPCCQGCTGSGHTSPDDPCAVVLSVEGTATPNRRQCRHRDAGRSPAPRTASWH
ncbi:hypothetical protein D0Q02_30415 [Micromonospora craniellae]|uniref:Uncharacterized protein n=1 Tax=Micromonospora craniellae TaxID=2294034 RepID=A0A372FQE7_9ACTN|nr:hypothetical protein D0Q02_30415 [Micromonospora craniellae]